MDMHMAVSRATSLHHRQLHSHTYSCFLELVIQVFSLLLHRATLIGPRSCQTRSHTQEGHTSFLQTSSIGITTTCSDNLLTHTTQLAWTRNPHVGVHLPPSPATKTATVFSAHTPSSVIKLTSATISGSLVHRICPLVGHVTSQRHYPFPQPSNDHTLSRHMTITIHTPPTTKPLSPRVTLS